MRARILFAKEISGSGSNPKRLAGSAQKVRQEESLKLMLLYGPRLQSYRSCHSVVFSHNGSCEGGRGGVYN